MAINIKVVPLLLVPAILAYMWSRKSARGVLLFVSIAAVVVLALSMPYILSNPLAILKATLGYRGLYGRWGISLILVGFPIFQAGHELAYRVLQMLVIALTLALAVYLNGGRSRPDLSNRLDLLSPFFIDARACSSIPGVARAVHFGVGFLVVLSLLHERRPLFILNLQFLVPRPMVFR